MKSTRFNFETLIIPLTRALEGGRFCPPPHTPSCPRYIKKTAARSVTVFGIPAYNSITHLVWKFWHHSSKGQVTRSGQSRNITSAPASKFKIALKAHGFSPNDLKLSGYDTGMDTELFGKDRLTKKLEIRDSHLVAHSFLCENCKCCAFWFKIIFLRYCNHLAVPP